MVRMVVAGVLALLAVLYGHAGIEGWYAWTCEQQVGLTPGTAEFVSCSARLRAADAEARSLVFGGLIRPRLGG